MNGETPKRKLHILLFEVSRLSIMYLYSKFLAYRYCRQKVIYMCLFFFLLSLLMLIIVKNSSMYLFISCSLRFWWYIAVIDDNFRLIVLTISYVEGIKLFFVCSCVCVCVFVCICVSLWVFVSVFACVSCVCCSLAAVAFKTIFFFLISQDQTSKLPCFIRERRSKRPSRQLLGMCYWHFY
jgi:hypothetical protein